MNKKIEQLRKILADRPNHVDALLALAWEFLDMGNYFRARKYLQRVRRLDPANFEAIEILQSIESRDLIQKYSNLKSFSRWSDILARGCAGDPRVIDRICDGLEQKSKWVRRECVRALGSIGGRKAAEALVRALSQPSLTPLVEQALKKICDRDLSPALLRKLIDNNKQISINIIFYLGYKKSANAAAALIEIARDPRQDKWVRGSASWALGQIGDASTLDILRRIMYHDQEDYVREESEEAYHRIVARTAECT